MVRILGLAGRVGLIALLSSLVFAAAARAHEVLPAIADMEARDGRLTFTLEANVEGFLAGIDLSDVSDTNAAPEAETYDGLRALPPEALEARVADEWPALAEQIDVRADDRRLPLELVSVEAGAVGDVAFLRDSTLTFAADLPVGTRTVSVGWAPALGALVLRQMGVDEPYDGYLEPGQRSPGIELGGGGALGPWASFAAYIPVGFDHIVPLGLDHILFVLGLFFLSTHLRPLLWQVTAFTAAHTITLALAALGLVSVPGAIVEPIIAASIVFVAVENIVSRGLQPWRPAVVFLFGLLHGLGFASVLAEFGLPEETFVPALLGFNVGVELGQLAVIAAAFLIVREAIRIDDGRGNPRWAQGLYLALPVLLIGGALLWTRAGPPAEVVPLLFAVPAAALALLCLMSVTFRDQIDAYRRIVAVPASAAIGLTGAWWLVERTLL